MGLEKEEIKIRKERIINFLSKNKKLLVLAVLIIMLVFIWYTRTSNLDELIDSTTDDYTLSGDPDPYIFFRYTKYIVENGKLMENDTLRNVPLGFNTAQEARLLPYMIAYFHKIANIFSNKSVNYSIMIFPAFMFILISLIFFLFVRKIFENTKYKDAIALIATAFLAVSSPLLQKTVAGTPEKESAAFFFMILAFYFFISAWKSEKLKRGIILSSLAGVSTAMMTFLWGGFRYVYMTISLFVFIEFITGKVNTKRLWQFLFWMFFSVVMILVFWHAKYNLYSIINAPTSTGLGISILGLLLTDLLIFNTKIKELGIICKLRKKLPARFVSVIVFSIFAVIFISVFFGFSFFSQVYKATILDLMRTSADRLSLTVSENIQPFLNDWEDIFDPLGRSPFLFIILFFLGSIFLFYESVKNMKKAGKGFLILAYLVFLFSFILSVYSANSSRFIFVYLTGFVLSAFILVYAYYKNYKNGKIKEFRRINSSYIFLLSFFLIILIGARSAMRLIMLLSFPGVILVSYLSVNIIGKVKKQKDKTFRLLFGIFAFAVIISVIFCFYFSYQNSIDGIKSLKGGSHTQQWREAMAWVRDNTKEDSVFAHWWDYGYWIQTNGERATILDGGNAIPYWNYLLGRHVLTGQSEKEALEFLYTHDADYLLIDSTDIGKYGAYSSIGSDENYDRYGIIHRLVENKGQMRKIDSGIIHIYESAADFFDQDYLIEDDGRQKLLPAYKTKVAGVLLFTGDKEEIIKAELVLGYQGKNYNIPISCVYQDKVKYNLNADYKGCLYIYPRVTIENNKAVAEERGRALFLTEKVMNGLLAKLYLFNEGENFELVHVEDSFVVRDLKNQGFNVENLLYWQGTQGAIKIWKINYPSDIKKKEEYLETNYPESLEEANSDILGYS